MSYSYENERLHVFSEDGQRLFLELRDRTKLLLRESGAVKLKNIISGSCGDPWHMMACVDRLVELNEIQEVPTHGSAKHRIFTFTNGI